MFAGGTNKSHGVGSKSLAELADWKLNATRVAELTTQAGHEMKEEQTARVEAFHQREAKRPLTVPRPPSAKAPENAPQVGVVEIDGNAPLARMHVGEEWTGEPARPVACQWGRAAAGVPSRRLDKDHVGTQAGQQLAAVCRSPAGQLQHAEWGESAWKFSRLRRHAVLCRVVDTQLSSMRGTWRVSFSEILTPSDFVPMNWNSTDRWDRGSG